MTGTMTGKEGEERKAIRSRTDKNMRGRTAAKTDGRKGSEDE